MKRFKQVMAVAFVLIVPGGMMMGLAVVLYRRWRRPKPVK